MVSSAFICSLISPIALLGMIPEESPDLTPNQPSTGLRRSIPRREINPGRNARDRPDPDNAARGLVAARPSPDDVSARDASPTLQDGR